MSSVLLDIIKPALRRAGITQLPGIIPSTDQSSELIPEVNRLLSSASLDGHKIFTTADRMFSDKFGPQRRASDFPKRTGRHYGGILTAAEVYELTVNIPDYEVKTDE